jgi:hypothetical protein
MRFRLRIAPVEVTSPFVFRSFPNSVWERPPRNSVSRGTAPATDQGVERSFKKQVPKQELGNQVV